MKKFYAVLRNFQARQPRVCQPHILADGSIAATPELQADAQLAYWCKKLNAKPSANEQALSAEDLPSPMPIDEHLRAEALEIVKRDDVYHKLLRLNGRKSAPDAIAPEVYKTLAHWIATPLTEHMVEILATGCTPNSWKGSQLVALPKKTTGDALALRPISLLLTSSKLFG
eukprot:2497656-Amphidinium_carterae.1